jgi:hypothetical protein
MSDHEETGPAEIGHTDETVSIDDEYDVDSRTTESHDSETALTADVFRWFEGLGDSSASTHSVGEAGIKRPSDAIQDVDTAATAKSFVNSEGRGLRRTAFDGVTDDGLVWIAVWHGEVNPQTRTLARAELARRNSNSVRQSMSASYTLAWAIFGLAALNLILFVWHITR